MKVLSIFLDIDYNPVLDEEEDEDPEADPEVEEADTVEA